MILPDLVFGSASVNLMSSGRAKALISFDDVRAQLLIQFVRRIVRCFKRYKSYDCRPFQLIRPAYHGRFGDCTDAKPAHSLFLPFPACVHLR